MNKQNQSIQPRQLTSFKGDRLPVEATLAGYSPYSRNFENVEGA